MAIKPGLVELHLTLEEIIDDEDNYVRDLLFILKRTITSPKFYCSDSKITNFRADRRSRLIYQILLKEVSLKA